MPSIALFISSIIIATLIPSDIETVKTEALRQDTRSAEYIFVYTSSEITAKTTAKNSDIRELPLEIGPLFNANTTATNALRSLTSSASWKQNSQTGKISLSINIYSKNSSEGTEEMITQSLSSVHCTESKSANDSCSEIKSIDNDSQSFHTDDNKLRSDISQSSKNCAGQAGITPMSNEAETLLQNYSESIDGNTTDIDFISKSSTDYKEILTAAKILDNLQVTCTLIGTVTNLFSTVTLFSHYDGFSRVILSLLRHQTLIDFFVCAMASTLILQPFNWLTGFYYVDIVVCHVWHGQALYWGGVTASTYNLILVAYERYLAVCRPFRHSEISSWSKRNFVKVFAGLYVLTIIIIHGTFIQTKLIKNVCVNEYTFDGPEIEKYFVAFVIFTYITTYFLPAVLMGLCYGLVIRQLRRRAKDVNLGRSNRLDRANDQLTRTAVAVTIVFVCTVGYDLHYYLLGYTGVVVYQLNTPLQKIGVFLSNLNSSATPFVYAAVMPIFRRSVVRTLCCFVGRRTFRDSISSSFGRRSTVVGESTAKHPDVTRNSISQSQSGSLYTISTERQQSVETSAIEIAC